VPEGDTVYLSAKNLNAALAGAVVTRCDIRVPAYAMVDLTGDVIEAVVSRGKHLLMRIGDHSIHSHLKMEGSWHLYRHGTAWMRPEHQARAVIETADWVAVGFSLGTLEVWRRAEESELDYLGPDLLGADWDATVAAENLLRDPAVPAFVALLEQRNLAGLGNEYVNDLLFLRGIHPWRPVGTVEMGGLLTAAHRAIHANKDRSIRSLTGDLRPKKTSWVYGRVGQPCRRCGTRVQKGQLGPTPLIQRDVYWCPSCQPEVL
jgi:endonuclease VIII